MRLERIVSQSDQAMTADVGNQQPDEERKREELVLALKAERRVFERIAHVGKWVASCLSVTVVASLVWAYLSGGLPAVKALLSGN